MKARGNRWGEDRDGSPSVALRLWNPAADPLSHMSSQKVSSVRLTLKKDLWFPSCGFREDGQIVVQRQQLKSPFLLVAERLSCVCVCVCRRGLHTPVMGIHPLYEDTKQDVGARALREGTADNCTGDFSKNSSVNLLFAACWCRKAAVAFMCKAHSRSFIICIQIRASFITTPRYGARC